MRSYNHRIRELLMLVTYTASETIVLTVLADPKLTCLACTKTIQEIEVHNRPVTFINEYSNSNYSFSIHRFYSET